MRRRILLSLLIFVAIGPVFGAHQHQVIENRSQSIAAQPVGLAAAPPAQTRLGALTFVEGWHLTSPHSRFGGISGMVMTGPRTFLMVSDGGQFVRFALSPDGRTDQVQIRRMPVAGRSFARKAFTDAESIMRDPVSGRVHVALEGIGQVWRYDPRLSHVETRRRSKLLFAWPANSGPESMTRLTDGRVLLLSEKADDDPRGTEGLLYRDDPAVPGRAPIRFFYDSQGKGLAVDAATLPDGRVLILHRRLGFDPLFTSIIAIADPRAIRADGVWRSVEVARFAPPTRTDNFEALAIAREGGATYLWVASDDNFNAWQSTYLFKFALPGAWTRAAPALPRR